MINIDGSGKKALTATSDRIEMCPSISPDGKKIVFCSFSDGQIYSADLKQRADNHEKDNIFSIIGTCSDGAK